MKYLLPFTVFITGACVLILELLFMRILAPYFGNTIYTTSGTITIILLALSIGYKLGGTLADRYASPAFFYGLILLSSITTALSHLSMGFVLPPLSSSLPLDVGPLVAGLMFMLIPNTLFGMLSPFAVKLQNTQLSKTGNVVGSMYFWSTLGSIAGSLSTTFFLIPIVGIDASLRLSYLTIFLLGLVGLVISKKHSKLIVAGIIVILFSLQANSYPINASSHIVEGLYEKIVVGDILYNDRPARVLLQNTNSSAAIFLDGKDLAFAYSKYVELTKIFAPNAKSALSLGAGAYTIPKWLHENYPDLQTDVVEIEPQLEQISRDYFELPITDKIKTHVTDGRRFLLDTSNQYDIIFVDMYSSRLGIPSHTATTEFFSLLKSKANPDGIIIMNLIGNLKDQSSPVLSQIATIKRVFPNMRIFAAEDPISNIRQNIMVIITNQPTPPNNKTWLKFADFEVPISKIDLHSAPILTDDKNPIDLLYAESL